MWGVTATIEAGPDCCRPYRLSDPQLGAAAQGPLDSRPAAHLLDGLSSTSFQLGAAFPQQHPRFSGLLSPPARMHTAVPGQALLLLQGGLQPQVLASGLAFQSQAWQEGSQQFIPVSPPAGREGESLCTNTKNTRYYHDQQRSLRTEPLRVARHRSRPCACRVSFDLRDTLWGTAVTIPLSREDSRL